MSIYKTVEVVCDLKGKRVLSEILMESGVVARGKLVIVDGHPVKHLDMLVDEDASVVVMTPVSGGGTQ